MEITIEGDHSGVDILVQLDDDETKVLSNRFPNPQDAQNTVAGLFRVLLKETLKVDPDAAVLHPANATFTYKLTERPEHVIAEGRVPDSLEAEWPW